MRKVLSAILALCTAAVLSACGAPAQHSAPSADTYGKGEPFSAGGEKYMLSEIVRLTDYDTDDTTGYGVVLLMKSGTAPVSFTMDGSDVAAPESLIGLTLDNSSGGDYKYANVAFAAYDGSEYKGCAQFEFSLPKNAEFPKKGTFSYNGDKTEKCALSFDGMKPERTVESERSEEAAEASPAATPLPEGEEYVSSFSELKASAGDSSITGIHICTDTHITADLEFERSDDLTVYVDEGVKLTISAHFIPVGCIVINNGTIEITGTYNSGLVTFVNTGVVLVRDGGSFSPGQSDIYNDSEFKIDKGGKLLIERGTQFTNTGTITNNGHVLINDGGALNDNGGSIFNDGIIDISSYFNGDITKISGSGTLSDNR